jgi:hypothetical protein
MYKKKGRREEQLTWQNRTDDVFPKHALLYKRYNSLDIRQDFRLIQTEKRRYIGCHLMGPSAT